MPLRNLNAAEAALIEILRSGVAGCTLIQNIAGQGWIITITGANETTHGAAGKTFAEAWAAIEALPPLPDQDAKLRVARPSANLPKVRPAS